MGLKAALAVLVVVVLVISVSARRRGEGGRGSDRRIRIQERKCKRVQCQADQRCVVRFEKGKLKPACEADPCSSLQCVEGQVCVPRPDDCHEEDEHCATEYQCVEDKCKDATCPAETKCKVTVANNSESYVCEKRGFCPANRTALATEDTDECKSDTDCYGPKKCCDSVCTRPKRAGLRGGPGRRGPGRRGGRPGGRRPGRREGRNEGRRGRGRGRNGGQ